jgi:hypothetical protein
MAEVFLSYAREDSARAEQIAQALEATGLDVFWDNEIPPGSTWADYIEAKLAQCKALIVLWSETSTKSQWVREEARLGRDKGVLIPVMIDASTPPFGFGEVQAANLANWNGETDSPSWRRFADAVTSASKGERTAAAAPMPSAPPRAFAPPLAAATAPPAKPHGVPVWVWVGGAVVATIVVLGVIGAISRGTPGTTQAAYSPPGAATAPYSTQAGPAPSGDSPQAIILAQLQQAQAALAQQGFQLIGQPYSGSLQQGQSWNVPTQMATGYEYRVIGVCDRDCNDLDLLLFDANGAPLTQDRSTSSQPVIGIQPAYSGNYTIQVQMYNCAVAPCYYALALYGRAPQAQ